jgi:long-chain acyl-CoA synthetase
MNSFAFLEKSARQWPDNVALLQGRESHNYREFRDRALAVGGNLRALGCEAGDRVAFCLANSPRIMEVIYGCFAAGLVVVPVNARLHAREMAYIVKNSGAKILVHGLEFVDGITAHADLFDGLEPTHSPMRLKLPPKISAGCSTHQAPPGSPRARFGITGWSPA